MRNPPIEVDKSHRTSCCIGEQDIEAGHPAFDEISQWLVKVMEVAPPIIKWIYGRPGQPAYNWPE
jgi:hypothetical protein